MLADEACSHTSVQRSEFVRNLKIELSASTVRGNALSVPIMHLPAGPKDGQGISKRGSMPTCRSRIDPASY